jgi:hypothetical protein
VGEHQDRLVNTILASSLWRRKKARQLQDAGEPKRTVRENHRAAQALSALANFVRDLPDTDRDVRMTFARSEVNPEGWGYRLDESTSTRLSRFGMNQGSWDGRSRMDENQMRNLLRRLEGSEKES